MLDNYIEETKPLFKMLKTEAFRFVVVRYNHYNVVRQIQKELQAQFPDRPSTMLKTYEVDYRKIMDEYYALGRGFLFLESFDDILGDEPNPNNTPTIVQNNERKRGITAGLNLRRDKLAQYPIALIVFIPATADKLYARIIMEKMPDLWSFRSLVLDIEVASETRETATLSLSKLTTSPSKKISEETLKAKRKELTILKKQLNNTPQEETAYRLKLYPQIATLLTETGDYKNALKIIEEWGKIYPYNNVWVARADVYKEMGKIEQALEIYDKVVQYCEQELTKNGVKLDRSATLGDALKGEPVSQEVYDKFIDSKYVADDLAKVLLKIYNIEKDKDKLIAILKRQLQLREDYGESDSFEVYTLIHYLLGEKYYSIENYDEASIHLKESIKIIEKNKLETKRQNTLIDSLSYLGVIYLRQKSYEKIFEIANKISTILAKSYKENSDEKDTKQSMALSYALSGDANYYLGNHDKAFLLLKKAKYLFTELSEEYPEEEVYKNNLKEVLKTLQLIESNAV